MREFSTGATRNDNDTKPDYRGFVSPQALKRFGQYMVEHREQADGKLRDSDNWKKGIPQREYLSSLLRHVIDLHDALERVPPIATDEKPTQDLLCAIWFNTQGLLHERLLRRDVGKAQPIEPKIPRPLTPSVEWLGAQNRPMHVKCTAPETLWRECYYYRQYQQYLKDYGAAQ